MKEFIQLTYSFCFLACLLDGGHINQASAMFFLFIFHLMNPSRFLIPYTACGKALRAGILPARVHKMHLRFVPTHAVPHPLLPDGKILAAVRVCVFVATADTRARWLPAKTFVHSLVPFVPPVHQKMHTKASAAYVPW